MTKENINKSYKKVSRLFILAYFSILLTVLVGYYFGNKNGLWEALSAEATALTSFYYIFLLTIIPLSFYVFFKKTAKWATLPNETEKLKKYENGAIWRLVGIWASGFIGTIIYFFLIHSSSIIFCVAISVTTLLFCRTSTRTIYADLNIEEE